MKTLAWIAIALSVTTGTAHATCFGSDSFYTCSDNSGNSYTVNRMGNMTTMNGYNANTGSTWSQDSMDVGGTTYHSGRAANGNSWNMTEQDFGSSTMYSGTDSSGSSFSRICNQYGCY